MSAKNAKKKPAGDIMESPSCAADLEPVDLDPPNPLARWQELADRDILIEHDGDAEKVLPFPRPAWADPDWDTVGSMRQFSSYRSAPVEVASMTGGGHNDGDRLRPAHFFVSARIHGSGATLISVGIRRFIDNEWLELSSSLPPESALELADVIRAAVDLVGGPQ